MLTTAPAFGSKYDATLSTADVAARIRRDIASATKDGALPAGTKTSVRISRGTISASIRITVTAFAGVALSVRRVRHDVESPTVFTPMPLLSAEGRRVVAILESLASAYRVEGDRLFVSVTFDDAILSAQRAEIEAAIRGSQEAA